MASLLANRPDATTTSFAPGRHRPPATLVEGGGNDAVDAPHFVPRHFSLPGAEGEMRRVEAALAAGDADAALRRARTIKTDTLPDEMQARVFFFMAQCCITLTKLGPAERYFDFAAQALERSLGFEEPSRIPCLLNRGCALVRLGRFKEACEVLRKARAVCDSLLSSPQRTKGRILLALAAAVLGTGDTAAAEAAYREALTSAEAEERAAGGGRPRAQPSRAVLASLLQARGDHTEAYKLLSVQRAALRDAVRRGEGSEAELAHTCGRLAVSAFVTRKESAAMAALRDATRHRVSSGTIYSSSSGAVQARIDTWVDTESEPLALAKAAKARAAPREALRPNTAGAGGPG